MAQNHVWSNASCWVGRSENLICPSESSWNEDAKIGIELICSSKTSRENQQNVFTKKAWIHWCVVNCRCGKNAVIKKTRKFPTILSLSYFVFTLEK